MFWCMKVNGVNLFSIFTQSFERERVLKLIQAFPGKSLRDCLMVFSTDGGESIKKKERERERERGKIWCNWQMKRNEGSRKGKRGGDESSSRRLVIDQCYNECEGRKEEMHIPLISSYFFFPSSFSFRLDVNLK